MKRPIMHADRSGARTGASAEALLGIYRYLPLPIYGCLWLAHRALPFLRPAIGERLGFGAPPGGKGEVIWLHGSSVGEMSSIGPVVSEIRRRMPDSRIVVTTMTAAGRKRAARELDGASVMLVPLDFLPAVRRFVRALRPAVLIVGETEIWPNLVTEARKAGASVVLVNGRISGRSFPRYRLVRTAIGHVLRSFDLLLMRSEVDAERIKKVGAPAERVKVAGNTKVDILRKPLSGEARLRLRERLGIESSRLVISLGSARTGETEILLDAVQSAFPGPRPLLVIAPRHVNNASQIEEACHMRGLSSVTLTAEHPDRRAAPGTDVVIIGRMGLLLDVYAISDIAVVGGTFKPLGGHNPLEPASQGTVTVVGPHIQNIADDIEYLRSRGVAVVTDEVGLGGVLGDLAADATGRKETAARAVEVVRNRKGVAGRCVDMMVQRGLLPGDGDGRSGPEKTEVP
jgi:3-deoxy-D-manno-octulosonic-acid transferase